MTHSEKNTIASFLSTLLVTGIFAWILWRMADDGRFAGPDGLTAWARTVLWMMPVGIIATIAATIGFNILAAVAERDPSPSFVVDERDRMIGSAGMKVAMCVASTGFILAIITLALGWTALAILNLILFSFAAADLLSSLAKLILYRRDR